MSGETPPGGEGRALIVVPPEAVIPAEPPVMRLDWRAERPVAPAPRRRRRFSLATPFLVLASPVILLALGVAIFLPPPLRVNPAHVMLIVGRVLSGARADSEA